MKNRHAAAFGSSQQFLPVRRKPLPVGAADGLYQWLRLRGSSKREKLPLKDEVRGGPALDHARELPPYEITQPEGLFARPDIEEFQRRRLA